MPTALQTICRAVVALGLYAASYMIGRSIGQQVAWAPPAEFVAIGLVILILAVWSWRQAPAASDVGHRWGAPAAVFIRRTWTVVGALLIVVLCAATFIAGNFDHYAIKG